MNTSSGATRLKEGGYRMGKGRGAILQVFEEATKPLNATEILSLLSSKNVNLNKTTVYRELEFLKNQHLVREVPVSSNTVYYESALQGHHHHLVCENCSMIIEVETNELEENIKKLSKSVAQNEQFLIGRHALEFFGTCANCS